MSKADRMHAEQHRFRFDEQGHSSRQPSAHKRSGDV